MHGPSLAALLIQRGMRRVWPPQGANESMVLNTTQVAPLSDRRLSFLYARWWQCWWWLCRWPFNDAVLLLYSMYGVYLADLCSG